MSVSDQDTSSATASVAPQRYAFHARHLAKSYGATRALVDVSFSAKPGKAHALLGENGAGKSTTIKLLSGLIRPDAGTIEVHGRPVVFSGPRGAHQAGMQTAFQELSLAPDLTVAENMTLGYEPLNRWRRIDRRSIHRSVADHLAGLGLDEINPRTVVRDLSLNLRQKLEIGRALYRDPKVLFLDEATSTLSGRDIDWLHAIVTDLKKAGKTVVMITHKMLEVRQFCEDVTVLRNGLDVGCFPTAEVEDEQLVELIIGRSLEATFPPKQKVDYTAAPKLKARGLSTRRRLLDGTFDLYAGEILGIAGLQGMGQHDLLQILFGAVPTTGGTLELDGQPVMFGSPRQAIDTGIAFVPEERKTEGLFLELSGRENMVIPLLDRVSRLGFMNRTLETAATASMMKTVQLDDRALYTSASAFSGGNQQKIVFGKWLLTDPDILLLFDPCRGVDVGTKHEIYVLVSEFAKAGGSVIIYSSETPELCRLCNRVLVLYGGKVVEVLSSDDGDIPEKEIMRATLGQSRGETGAAGGDRAPERS